MTRLEWFALLVWTIACVVAGYQLALHVAHEPSPSDDGAAAVL